MNSTRKSILVFKHMPSQNPGIFRALATEYKIVFDEIDLHAGDAIPNLDHYDALWVMGGTMYVWEEEEYPWLVDEKKAIRGAIEELNLPYLGICLGHQLLADVFGGEVGLTDNHELGVFQITPTPEGLSHPFMANWPQNPGWTNVHLSEIKRPPNGATILASSERCEYQVMSLGQHVYSCQFHPEVCESTLPDWLEIPGIEPALIEKLGVCGFKGFKLDIESNRIALNVAAEQLLKNWVSLVFK